MRVYRIHTGTMVYKDKDQWANGAGSHVATFGCTDRTRICSIHKPHFGVIRVQWSDQFYSSYRIVIAVTFVTPNIHQHSSSLEGPSDRITCFVSSLGWGWNNLAFVFAMSHGDLWQKGLRAALELVLSACNPDSPVQHSLGKPVFHWRGRLVVHSWSSETCSFLTLSIRWLQQFQSCRS